MKLTEKQTSVLWLCRAGCELSFDGLTTASAIARARHFDIASVEAAARQLADMGLISITEDENGRVCYSITDKGRAETW